jgi:c-di-GMP-binding flagellar brake protein YcgR
VRKVERRQRYRVQTEIEVSWSVGEDAERLLGTIVDLSAAGARLVTPDCPQVGDTVVIRLQASHPPMELDCPARVVRVADISIPGQHIWAVSFEELDLDQQARIARFVFLEAARTRGSRPGYAQAGDHCARFDGEQRAS